MTQQFQCIKIKDGLYIGNIVAAHDYQFLISNKFGYIVNCTAQIPNIFQHQNLRYLKFKLIQNKSHKLWDQTLKKLTKLQKFIEQAEQFSLCCLIHSFHGENRSLVFIIGYLMKKYQWRFKKCLQYLKSKQIFIGLSNHYISQLQVLEQILSKNSILSFAWTPPYLCEQEEILSKTYLNSLQGKYSKANQMVSLQIGKQFKQKKIERRIVWLDRLEKKKYKEQQIAKKERMKQKAATHIQTVKHRIPQYDLRDPQLIKNVEQNVMKHVKFEAVKGKQSSNTKLNEANQRKQDKHKEGKQLVIKLQQKQEKHNKNRQSDKNTSQNQKNKNIYQLTINNYINPNINIISKSQPLIKKTKKEKTQKDYHRQPNLQEKEINKQQNDVFTLIQHQKNNMQNQQTGEKTITKKSSHHSKLNKKDQTQQNRNKITNIYHQQQHSSHQKQSYRERMYQNVDKKQQNSEKNSKKQKNQKNQKRQNQKQKAKTKLKDKQKKNSQIKTKKSTEKMKRARSQKQVVMSREQRQKQDEVVQKISNLKDNLLRHEDKTLKNEEKLGKNELKFRRQIKQIKQNNEQIKQKTINGNKERDIKKQLKKQIQKVQKQKSSHSLSSLYMLYPISNLAQHLIKNGTISNHQSIKRSSTPTRKQRKKNLNK